MNSPVRIYYWSKQRHGNCQIKIGKKRDIEWFKRYIKYALRPLDNRIRDSIKEPGRRYYVENEHIKYMRDDEFIDLKEGYIWKKNKYK
jgi:hypothetical protein